MRTAPAWPPADPAERFAGMPAVLYAYGFPRWKRPVLRQCFPGRRLIFAGPGRDLPAACWVLLWGAAAPPPGLGPAARILRLEDGFLRSVGLGAELVRPLSWVVDGRAMHYDAGRVSDLEALLAAGGFDAALLARAARLRGRIVRAGLTKYNVGARSWRRPAGAGRVVLAIGQVESDASLLLGARPGSGNMDLLRAVRAAEPDAHILYKPHPDVMAGLRRRGRGEDEAARWCDEVVGDAAMAGLLAAVDAVHVLTSLTGFEALLRGKPVTCHGRPFYSGWGLTADLLPPLRPRRPLSLDELVAGALIEYPLYLSRDGRRLISPEEALDVLCEWNRRAGGKEAWWRGIYRFLLRRFIGVR